MHVVAGTAKGRLLAEVVGGKTRPTASKVKEGIFSAIQFDLFETVVLDLYAGSGQMGIEALSRGAKKAIFIDNSRQSQEVITKNLIKTEFTNNGLFFMMDAIQYILSSKEEIDIAVLDPPYYEGADLVMTLPELSKIMSSRGIIICETSGNIELPKEIGNKMIIHKEYRYGKTKVTVYRKEV